MRFYLVLFALLLSALLNKCIAGFDFTPYHMDLRQVLEPFGKCFVHIVQADVIDKVCSMYTVLWFKVEWHSKLMRIFLVANIFKY